MGSALQADKVLSTGTQILRAFHHLKTTAAYKAIEHLREEQPVTNPLLNNAEQGRYPAWDRASALIKETRPVQSISEIVIRGAVDVVFFRASEPCMVVAGEGQEAIRGTKTRFEGSKLILEHEGVLISNAGGNIQVSGTGNIVAGGSIHVSGRSVTMQFNGPVGNVVLGQHRTIVGIALPQAPAIRIKGSGDVTLYDLRQSQLHLAIQGSGDIAAFGQVEHLEVQVTGSGDVDGRNMTATSAILAVTGSGEIHAHVVGSVKAVVTGSGDILIQGNPTRRDHSVTGSGQICFED